MELHDLTQSVKLFLRQSLASALSHVEQRVVSNDYTFSFASRRYQIARQEVKAGMRERACASNSI